MNKNLKTILVGIFTLIASTEMIYPIIFTGPGRRAAHRHEEQNAYAAGVAAGSTDDMMAQQDQMDDSEDDSDVEVQMLSGDNDSDSSDSDSSYGVISVASGDESDDENQATNNLDQSFMVTPDNEDNFNDNLAYGDDLFARGQAQEPARQEVVAEQQESQNDLSREGNFDGYFIDQALQDAELDDDSVDTTARNLFGSDDESDSDNDVATQSIEPGAKTEEIEKTKEIQAAQAQPAVAVEPAPVVTSVEKTTIIAPVQEQIKIIKVYPVYDAAGITIF